jgi:hypothetical protein
MMFHSSWDFFSLFRDFFAGLEAMEVDECPTQESVIHLLKACGFADMTHYKQSDPEFMYTIGKRTVSDEPVAASDRYIISTMLVDSQKRMPDMELVRNINAVLSEKLPLWLLEQIVRENREAMSGEDFFAAVPWSQYTY